MWLPEAPSHSGLYACRPNINGQNCTLSLNEALTFDNEEDCQKWCDANPKPIFIPVQHAFGEVVV